MAERRTTTISLNPDEEKRFKEAMHNDGMKQLSTWMKSVCSRYAAGRLTPKEVTAGSKAIEGFTRQLLYLFAANQIDVTGLDAEELKDEDSIGDESDGAAPESTNET